MPEIDDLRLALGTVYRQAWLGPASLVLAVLERVARDRGGEPEPEHAPMALDEALRIIAGTDGRRGAILSQRVLSVLGAAGFVPPDPAEFPDSEKAKLLAARYEALITRSDEFQDIRLPEAGDMPPAFTPVSAAKAEFDGGTLYTRVWSRGTLPGASFAAVNVLADPEQWSTHWAPTFKKSLRMGRDPKHQLKKGEWALDEEVDFGIASFQNILRISQQERSGRVRTDFSLIESGQARVATGVGALTSASGLTLDEGHVAFDDTGDGVRFSFEKTVRFVDLTVNSSDPDGKADYGHLLNYLAPATLCMWVDAGIDAMRDLAP